MRRPSSAPARGRLAALAIAAVALAAAAAPAAAAAAGDLDSSFGSAGVAHLAAGAELNAVAAEPDGGAVAVGRTGSSMIAAKLTPAGQLDASFGSGGIATVGAGVARAVAIQADGKIVVVGDDCSAPSSFCSTGGLVVARLNPNGSLDSSFGSGGIVHTAATGRGFAVALGPGGQIVAGGDIRLSSDGFRRMLVARLNPNGSLDSSFPGGGVGVVDLGQDTVAKGIAVQPNGKIVIAGSQGPGAHQVTNGFAVRLDANGGVDSTFGGGSTPAGAASPGIYWYFHPVSGASSSFNAVVLDPKGGIALAGWDAQDQQQQALFAHLGCGGQPQAGFGAAGTVTLPSSNAGSIASPAGANGVGIGGGDAVIGAGRFQNSGLAEVGVWGVSATGAQVFSTSEVQSAEGRGLAIDPSGSILVAGDDLSTGGQVLGGFVARYIGTGAPPAASNVCGAGGPPPAGQAPTVTTGGASDVTQSGATVSGTVNPNGQSTTYHFEYGTTSGYGQSTAPAGAGDGTAAVAAPASLTGLDPGTTYHYRLVATNATGTSVGGDRTFTTSGGPPAVGSRARVLAHQVFLTRSGGAAKVYLGCLGAARCSGKLVLRAGGVVAKAPSFRLRANRGALVRAPLTKRGTRGLRHAKRGALAVTLAVTNQDGSGDTGGGRLFDRGAKQLNERASLGAGKAFAKPGGGARIWLACLGRQRCEGRLRLVEDGRRVARASYSSAADSAKLVRIALDAQATAALEAAGRLRVEAKASNRNGNGASHKLTVIEAG